MRFAAQQISPANFIDFKPAAVMKKIIKKLLQFYGYEIKKRSNTKELAIEPGSPGRPVGSMQCLLQDLKQRGLQCHNILDVGANDTSYSRMVWEIFPAANFCLIEPLVEMQENLKDFCTENKNAVYFLAGAGAKKDTLTLTVFEELAGSSLVPLPSEALKKRGRQREIEIITIDELIETHQIKIPELIKLDIQGFELEALKGAQKTFGFTEVYIIEVSLFPYNESPHLPVLSDVINFMLEREYVVYDFPGFLRRPYDGALGQCDICFVKKNGFLKKYNGWS